MSIFITMNHHEFSPYHNKHISFLYSPPDGPEETLTGVLVDLISYDQKQRPTEYVFIRTSDLSDWQRADENGDTAAQEGLQRVIDIDFVSNPELVQHPV